MREKEPQVALSAPLPNVGGAGYFTYSWTEWIGTKIQNFDLVNKNIFVYAHILQIDSIVCKKLSNPIIS